MSINNEQLYDIDENHLLLHLFHFLLTATMIKIGFFLAIEIKYSNLFLLVEQYVVMESVKVR